MNINKINPKYYFFNYPLKTNKILNKEEENLAYTISSKKADSPGKIWGKITNPADQFIILCLIIFFSSLFIFITFLLLFLIIYLN
jgi:hypothetical protein